MIRLLIFVEPKPLPEHLFRNQSWLTLPLQLASYLHRDAANAFEISVALPKRLAYLIEPHRLMLGDRVYLIDEGKIVSQIHRAGKTIRQAWMDDFTGQTPLRLHQNIDRQIQQALPNQNWDVVLCFGEPCRYSFAENAIQLNMETSPFGRYPFNFSFFLDHHGLFRESTLAGFFADGKVGQYSQLTTKIRQQAWDMVTAGQKLFFYRAYERYLMLPLQASNYSSFDAQAFYQTQLDYLFDVCSQVPADTGILLTEHPQISSVDFDRHFPETLRGLRDCFPQLTYIPRAKFFHSASLCLLPQLDAVWTLASNVGPVASFLGVPMGTGIDSHLHYSADADSPAELLAKPAREFNRSMARLGHHHGKITREDVGETGWSGKLVFDWMFQHYLIPWHVARRPHWFVNYLNRRLEACRQSPDTLAGYPATELEVTDFFEANHENSPKATRNFIITSNLQGQVNSFRARQTWEAKQFLAQGGQKTFLLLNDTAALETYRHLGCIHVNRVIQTKMQERGFRLLQAINSRAELGPEIPVPDWVVINGEGSFHHNSPRINELTEMALAFQNKGARVALINSIWEANSEASAEPLKQFDLIAVRDGRSLKSLEKVGVQALCIPDLSLTVWQDDGDQSAGDEFLFTDNIVYRYALGMFDAMLALGGSYLLLDDRQIVRMDEDGCFACLPEGHQKIQLLSHTRPLTKAKLVVAGRFHVAVACLALGKPFVYVESNTQKLSALCEDVGLPIHLLNVTAEIESADWQALSFRLQEVEGAFGQFKDQIASYCQQGAAQTNDLFARFE